MFEDFEFNPIAVPLGLVLSGIFVAIFWRFPTWLDIPVPTKVGLTVMLPILGIFITNIILNKD